MKTRLNFLIGALAALTLSGAVLAQDSGNQDGTSQDSTNQDSNGQNIDSTAPSYFVFKLGSEYNLEVRDTPECSSSQSAQEQASYPNNAGAGAAFVVAHGFVLPADSATARDDVDAFVQDNGFTPQGEWQAAATNGLSRAFTSEDAPGYDYVVDVYPLAENADGQSSALCVTMLQDRAER